MKCFALPITIGLSFPLILGAQCLNLSSATVSVFYAANTHTFHSGNLSHPDFYYVLCGPNTLVADTLFHPESIQAKSVYINSASKLWFVSRPGKKIIPTVYARATSTIAINKWSDSMRIFVEPGVLINDLSGKAVVTVTDCIVLPACVATGEREEIPDHSIIAFPNPAYDQLNVNTSGSPEQIRIYDGTNRQILCISPDQDPFPIDLRQFAPGVYFVRIGFNYQKIIKSGN